MGDKFERRRTSVNNKFWGGIPSTDVSIAGSAISRVDFSSRFKCGANALPKVKAILSSSIS